MKIYHPNKINYPENLMFYCAEVNADRSISSKYFIVVELADGSFYNTEQAWRAAALVPGDAVPDWAADEVKAVVAGIHTPEVVETFKAKRAAEKAAEDARLAASAAKKAASTA